MSLTEHHSYQKTRADKTKNEYLFVFPFMALIICTDHIALMSDILNNEEYERKQGMMR
jgi:hypothetical protein